MKFVASPMHGVGSMARIRAQNFLFLQFNFAMASYAPESSYSETRFRLLAYLRATEDPSTIHGAATRTTTSSLPTRKLCGRFFSYLHGRPSGLRAPHILHSSTQSDLIRSSPTASMRLAWRNRKRRTVDDAIQLLGQT